MKQIIPSNIMKYMTKKEKLKNRTLAQNPQPKLEYYDSEREIAEQMMKEDGQYYGKILLCTIIL